MKTADGLKNEAIIAALDEAIAGKHERLYKQLAIVSGLPGVRMNVMLAQGFATECGRRGKAVDALLFKMASLDADEAPGATATEFFPVCGIMGLGARAHADAAVRKKAVPLLHDAAADLRFRVREAVPYALARIGGDVLVHEVASWTDGYFQAAAVLMAMADARWLDSIDDEQAVIDRMDECYELARTAPRSVFRYPGHKALVEALGTAPAHIAVRFGVPIFDCLAAWSDTAMPELREAIARNLKANKGRHSPDIERVRAALAASLTPPRDPTKIIAGMRSRGKKRRQH